MEGEHLVRGINGEQLLVVAPARPLGLRSTVFYLVVISKVVK